VSKSLCSVSRLFPEIAHFQNICPKHFQISNSKTLIQNKTTSKSYSYLTNHLTAICYFC
jgi:hypothetical protein